MRRVSTWEWGKKHIESDGLQAVLDMPFSRTILDRLDGGIGKVNMIFGAAQVFKSAIGQIHALAHSLLTPGPRGWYTATDPSAAQFADGKFNRAWDSCPPLRKLIIGDPARRPKQQYHLANGASLLIMSAGIELNRNSLTLQGLYLDESWTYDAGHVAEIQKRRGSFDTAKNYFELHMNTGPLDGTEAAQLWEQSAQSTWHSACPECGGLFPLEFGELGKPGGIRYDHELAKIKDGTPWAKLKESVRYECPKCQAQLKCTPATMKALNDPKRGAGFIDLHEGGDPEINAMRVPGLACKDWGDVAKRWIIANRAKAKGDMSLLEEVVTKDLAKVWKPLDLYKAEVSKQVGAYDLGETWADAAPHPVDGYTWTICTVDVQDGYYVVVIRAWNRNAKSRQVWHEKVMTPGAIKDLCDRFHVHPKLVFLDARWDTDRVKRIAAQWGWACLMGDKSVSDYNHPDGIRRIFAKPEFVDPFIGTEGGGKTVVMTVLFSKFLAMSRLNILRHEKGQDGEPLWTGARNASEEFWKEVNAFSLVREENGDGTYTSRYKASGPDHYADAETMQVVVVSMAGFIGEGILT